MKIMVLDNYDSFTYNIVQYVRELSGLKVEVFRNDQIDIQGVSAFDKIIISPGPGVPRDAGITLPMIRELAPTKSIFGVCLGCQAIAESYGGELLNLDKVYHGVSTYMKVEVGDELIFRDVPESFTAGRYHSWVIREDKLPGSIEVTARDEEGMIMAVRHREYDLRGVQFHPESVLTRYGKQMLMNWLGV